MVIFGIGFTVLVCASMLANAAARPTDRHVGLFADTYDVPLTESNERMLRLYIWRSRMWRSGGGALGLLVSVVAAAVERDGGTPANPVGAMLIGFGVGALIGEWTRPRPKATVARATLARRRVSDYVRPWLVWVAAGVLAAAFAALAVLVRDRVSGDLDTATRRTSVGAATIASLLAAASLVSARFVARRPSPAVASDVDAVSHATRSAAVMTLTGFTAASATSAVLAAAWTPTLDSLGAGRAVGIAAVLIAGYLGFLLAIRSIPRYGLFQRTARLPRVGVPITPSANEASA